MLLKYSLAITIIVFLILIDQLTKNYIVNNVLLLSSHHITSFFNIVHYHNSGAAFGILSDLESTNFFIKNFFYIIPTFIVIYLVYLLYKINKIHYVSIISLSFIIAGAIANLIDRIRYGYVIDFLDFHLFGYHWPAFNVADSTIVIGVMMIIFLKNEII